MGREKASTGGENTVLVTDTAEASFETEVTLLEIDESFLVIEEASTERMDDSLLVTDTEESSLETDVSLLWGVEAFLVIEDVSNAKEDSLLALDTE